MEFMHTRQENEKPQKSQKQKETAEAAQEDRNRIKTGETLEKSAQATQNAGKSWTKQ
jgi:hypothetical protein